MLGCITESTRRALQAAGADIEVILPVQDIIFGKIRHRDMPKLTETEKRLLIEKIKKCDGLFLPGGGYYSEYDRFLTDYAIQQNIPLLGVCMGMQLMSGFGQEQIQLDPADKQHDQGLKTSPAHPITLEPRSHLAQIMQTTQTEVNSHHKYQVHKNKAFKVVAKSPDGAIEAIEKPDNRFCIGVQWHPERDFWENRESQKIIETFINIARNHKV